MGSPAEYTKLVRHSIPTDILDDLCSRFIINLPREERSNLVRICFQIEQAHWFFLDYYCTDETRLDPCGIRDFAAHIFQHVPQLREHFSSLDEVLDNWREYKQMVPTYGAILLDTELTHVLLVKSFWTRASWGFPKGKVNEDEEPWKCAAREVLEETGFDISRLINKNDYIETIIHEQIVRLYIVGYVPRDTKFQPRTRNEIKACEWFPLADLPSNKKDMTPKVKMGVSPNAFYMVLPFVKRMRRWVAERVFSNTKRIYHKSMGDIETSTVKNKYNTISQGFQNEIQEYQNQNNYTPKQYKNHGNWHGNNYANNQSNYHGNNDVINQGNYHGNNQGNGPGNGYSNNYANSHYNNYGNSHWNNYGNSHNYSHGNNHSYNHANTHSYNHDGSHSYNYGNSHSNNHNISNWNNHGNRHFYNQNNAHINNQNSGHINNQNNAHVNNQNNGHHIKNYKSGHFNNQSNVHCNNHGHWHSIHNNHGHSHINNHGHSHINNQNNSQFNDHGNNHRNESSALKITLDYTKNDKKFAKRQLFTPQNTRTVSISPVQEESSPINKSSPINESSPNPNNEASPNNQSRPNNESQDLNAFYNFVAPSWANFKLDRQAILDCFT